MYCIFAVLNSKDVYKNIINNEFIKGKSTFKKRSETPKIYFYLS